MIRQLRAQFNQSVVSVRQHGSFLHRISVLLEEGYTFHDSLVLVTPHHCNQYDELLLLVETDLKAGLGPSAILRRFGFSSSDLLPIAIAEIDGQLHSALEELATRISKKEERRKRVVQLALYPAVLFMFFALLIIGFRQFFLPNFQLLLQSRHLEESTLYILLPRLVAKLPDFFLIFLLFSLLLLLSFSLILRKLSTERKMQIFNAIPFVGTLYRMKKTRDFSSEIGSLLQSGLSLQQALRILMDQQFDPVLAALGKSIQQRVIFGEPFHHAVELTDGLLKELAVFIQHGTNNGHLPKELILYSEQLNEQMDEKITKALSSLQPVLFCILALCIITAYLAILLPIYELINQI